MADVNEKDDVSEIIDESDEDINESIDFDNDEGFDLDGDPDEDIETALTDEDGEETEVDEEDELDESEETDEETDEEAEEPAAPDEKDARIEELTKQLDSERKQRENLKSLSKETLEKMGIKVDGDVEEALEKALAESEGVTLEEYRKNKQTREEIETARLNVKRQKFEELSANDLTELRKSFPDLLKIGHIKDCFDNFDDFVKFGRLRDAGIEPKEAYLAVNGNQVRSKQAVAAKQKAMDDGKSHITSVAPKKASDDTVVMPRETLREWREMFPDKTDKEIKSLYKQTL